MNDKPTPIQRFIAKVAVSERGCWLWLGAKNTVGRPFFSYNLKLVAAHKWMWERENGPVPEGLVLDHFFCNDPGCVNPDHIRPVTNRENILRGSGVASVNLSKDKCPICGGEYIWSTGTKIQRYCRPCKTKRASELKKSKREKV